MLWSLRIYWLLRFFCIVDLGLLCRVSCFLASGTSMSFCWLIPPRERTLLYRGVSVGGRYGWKLVNLVYLGLETVVMVLGWRSLLVVSVVRVARRLGRFRLLLLCGFSF